MNSDDRKREALEQLRKRFTEPVVLSVKDKQLLAELVRGAEVCFANAEQIFQEASLLREHKHFSRSLFLYQIAMEECAKVDMIGAAATGLTLGRPVDLQALEKDFRDHKAKNFANAYLSEPSEAEKSARGANDRQAANEAFEHSQREIHGFLNTAKNASMYVDFKQGKFISPDEVVGEEEATIIAAVSNYFMTLTYPRLKSLRRMLEEPQHHAEFMSAVGDVLVDSLANGVSIMGMEESLRNRITETAKRLIAKSRTNTGFSSGGQ